MNLEGCPENGELTTGQTASFQAKPPSSNLSYVAGPYWGTQGTIDGVPFTFTTGSGPFLFSPILDQGPGVYCFNFSAVLSDGTPQTEECCFEVIEAVLPSLEGCPEGDVILGSSLVLTAPTTLTAPYEITHTIDGVESSSTSLSVAAPTDTTGQHSVSIKVCKEGVVQTESNCLPCTEPCPCPATVSSVELFSTTHLHRYSQHPVVNADGTKVLLDLVFPNVGIFDIDTGAFLSNPTVSSNNAWSCKDPDILWGTIGTSLYARDVVAGTNGPAIYTAPAGTTQVRMGWANGTVQQDQCVVLDELTNGVLYMVALDLTTTPATVISRVPAPANYRYARMSLDCSRILVLTYPPGSNFFQTATETVYDTDFVSNPVTLNPTLHSDFVLMPDGAEWLVAAFGYAQNINTGQIVQLDSALQSAGGHWSGLASLNCPGLALWSPEDGNGGPMRLISFNNDMSIDWEIGFNFNHGTMDQYNADPMASISRCGQYIFVRSDEGVSGQHKQFKITLDNSACPPREFCEIFYCDYNVVSEENNPPIAEDQECTTAQDTPVSITLTGSDPDDDQITFVVHSQPSNGTLTGTVPNVTYTPNTGFSGTDTFTFCARDEFGLLSEPATKTIVVVPDNEPPVSGNVDYMTPIDTPVNVMLTGFDPEGGPITYVIHTQPTNGSITGSGQNWVYTPNPGYVGFDSFMYCTKDEEGLLSQPSSITIEVKDTNSCNKNCHCVW